MGTRLKIELVVVAVIIMIAVIFLHDYNDKMTDILSDYGLRISQLEGKSRQLALLADTVKKQQRPKEIPMMVGPMVPKKP